MAEQMLVEGNAAVIAGDLMTARMHYTNAVKADPENVIAVQKRAMVNNQLGFYSDALEDAQKALSLSPSSAQAEYQAGIAYYKQGRLTPAKASFERALKHVVDGTSSTPSPANLADTIKAWMTRFDKDSAKQPLDEDELLGLPKKAAAPSTAPVPVKKPKYEWYQTGTHVVLSFMIKEVQADKSTVTVAEDGRSISASLALPGGTDWVQDIDLYDVVQRGADGAPEAISIRPTKVEVKLAKVSQYMWPALEQSAAPVAPEAVKAKILGTTPGPSSAPQPVPVPASGSASASASAGSAAAAQPAAKPKKKDWNAIEKEVDAGDPKPEGEEALMKLFRQIYSNGDEETRKAMVKSFQTSGGTVLSTNWKEVKDADYEKSVKAPDGMEAKKWES